jgi:hypothetical protein
LSLRPNIFGLRLARLRGLLGCGDQSVVDRVSAELSSVAPELQAEARDIAARAVMTGVPFVGLDAEGDAHVAAAIALSKIDQARDDVGSSVWKMDPAWDLGRLFPALAREDHPFRTFLEGRPIFGERIVTGWSYYGFLDRQEVELLRFALRPVRESLASAPEMQPPSLDAIGQLREELTQSLEAVTDDEALDAFFGRLIADGLVLGDRAKDLAFDAARHRGWPDSSSARAAIETFIGRFNTARAKAQPRRLLPFLDELDGWLARIATAGRDLFLFTA